MAKLARIAGKALAGAAPVMMQKWISELEAAEAERNREWQGQQNQMTRDQNQANADRTFALDEAKTNKAIEQLDLAIENAQIDLNSKRALEGIRNQIANAETPEERYDLFTTFMNMQGEEPDPRFDYETVQGIDPETLERVQSLFRIDRTTNEIQFIGDANGVAQFGQSGGQGQGGAGGIPQAAIDELMGATDRDQAIAEFDEAFGAGSAQRYLDANNAGAAQQPASSTPAQAQPAGSVSDNMAAQAAGSQPEQVSLAMPGEGTPEQRAQLPNWLVSAANAAKEFLTSGGENQRRRLIQMQNRPAVQFVGRAIAKGEYPEADTEEKREQIQQAIDSGEFDAQVVSLLEAWLAQNSQ